MAVAGFMLLASKIYKKKQEAFLGEANITYTKKLTNTFLPYSTFELLNPLLKVRTALRPACR